MSGKLLKVSLLALGVCAIFKIAMADNIIQNEQIIPHKLVATVLPEDGKLAGDDGKLHQGIALECVAGRPGGVSYYSSENDLSVAINSVVNIEVRVDDKHPVRFFATRKFNEKDPGALTAKSYDVDNTLRLINELEMAKNDVEVKVWNTEENKSKTFKLKAGKMKGAIDGFRTFCNGV